MRHGVRLKRRACLAFAAAAALGGALVIQGCTTTATSTATTSAKVSSGSPLTLSQAQAAFSSYVTTSNTAARTGDQALAESVLNGVAADTTHTAYTIARQEDSQPPYTQYAYGTPAFYLLAPPSGYPQYFLVSVTRTPASGGAPLTGSPQDSAAGVQLPSGGSMLMLFERSGSSGPWQLASASQLTPGEPVPPLATDARGYVSAVSFAAAGGTELVRPGSAPPLQAAVVDDGPSSAASQVVAAGPLTTGLYESAVTSARGFTVPRGDVYQRLLEGSSYGRLALKMADGGVLVLYAMYLNTTVETPSALHQDIPVLSGPPITVPDFVKPLIPADKHQGYGLPTKRLQAQDILSFALIDPPAASKGAKIQVIAIGGGLYMATSS